MGRKKKEPQDLELVEKQLKQKRELIGLVFLALDVLIIFSLVGKAGFLGGYINFLLLALVGKTAYFLPIFIVPFIYQLIKGRTITLNTIFGFLCLFFALAALFSLFGLELGVSSAAHGGGGGLLGYFVAYVFFKLLSFWVSFVLFLIWFFVGLLLSFNFSFSSIWSFFTKKEVKEKDEDEIVAMSPFRRRALSLFPFTKKSQLKNDGGNNKLSATTISDETWSFPPLDLLSPDEGRMPQNQDVGKMSETIKKTLADYGIEVEKGEINIGPTFTQFTFKTKTGVKLDQIVSRSNEIAYALARHPIRVEAPIPGKSAVGIEIPNKNPVTVHLRSLLQVPELNAKKSSLALVLGKDVSGRPFVADLSEMPHLLIAGATGTGKSICLNSILMTLFYRNSPKTLRLILVDPKRVEFSFYNDVPHLLSPVITEVDKTISAFRWATEEMDRRYIQLQERGKRNIAEYNRSVSVDKKMPYIIIAVDELASLMAQARREVEASIVRLTQMARATGIHLILATQRPSTDVITGLIKANITHRIAFQVASQVDSRTILDHSGADKLLGRGDMLYQSADSPKPKRLQGPFVSEEEIRRVTNFLRERETAHYQEEVTKVSAPGFGLEDAHDDLFEQAAELIIQQKKASATLLQRRLRIGYARAARLIDILEDKGIVGPQEGSRPRKVLIDEPTFQEMKEKDLFN